MSAHYNNKSFFLSYQCLTKSFSPISKGYFLCKPTQFVLKCICGRTLADRHTEYPSLFLCRSTKQHIIQTVVPGGQ